MGKLLVDYDKTTGEIRYQGCSIGFTVVGLTEYIEPTAVDYAQDDINHLKELKSAGFTVDEILQMKREGLF